MKEGGCPITKMFKVAGTPHVGAIFIVLFVIAGAAYYLLATHNEGSHMSEQDALNAELELVEESSKRAPSGAKPKGYIRIMNDPGKEPVEPQVKPVAPQADSRPSEIPTGGRKQPAPSWVE